jgi:DNA-binding NarL/FixJ family response regulator
VQSLVLKATKAARPRLLLVDDDRPFCDLVRPLLDPAFELRVVHGVRDAVAAVAFCADVVIVDLILPDGDGVDVISRLALGDPELPILVLSSVDNDTRVLGALRAGARGYLFKEDVAQLARSVDELRCGQSPMSAGVARLVLRELRSLPGAGGVAGVVQRGTLTTRELEVVEHLRRGLTYEEVGAALGVSTNTVRTYIRSVYEKLQVSTKTEAVLEVLRRGWLS